MAAKINETKNVVLSIIALLCRARPAAKSPEKKRERINRNLPK
jgi:hypothetical protein